MQRELLKDLVTRAVQAAVGSGALPEVSIDVQIELPKRPEHGDFATNAAMVLASQAKCNPREVAQTIVDHMPEDPLLAAVEIAGPGFINFRLSQDWLAQVIARCCEQGEAYGRCNAGGGKRVQVEFVSANPVGPIHIGNARGGPYGDVLASLLDAVGYNVEREYYINDGPDNTQLKLFGASVQARYRTLAGEPTDLPENGYQGQYVIDLAQGLLDADGVAHLSIPVDDEGALAFSRLVEQTMVDGLREDCRAMGIEFDVWFSEQSLHETGAVAREVDNLVARDLAYEKDGAVWLKTGDFGDEDDRVLRRSNGAFTYIASDLAYAANKFDRGFEHLVYVWGPDHAGYVPRLKAAIDALGRGTCEIIIYQQVRFLENGEPLGLSKRRGAIVSVRDLVDEIGRDATRFFFLMRTVDAHLDFDLDLARAQSQDNPVYYVQYAHARICSILREGVERGIIGETDGEADLSLLTDPDELALMRQIAEYPHELLTAAEFRAPHRLTFFARELAQSFHQFYGTCRVLDPDAPALSQARLKLVQATQTVLRNCLGILGISAPERM
ncbi:MAG: arginine--tRNA ligase [Armatimonadetes bacterium]|nr:arginine--tRNA ligase [Armatimonadota bacterium]